MGRTTIVKDLLQIYQQYPELCFQEIRVVFRGESGVDMGGLTRELFSVFWTAIYLAGNVEKVPVLTPKVLSDFLYLGRSYLMVLYLVGGYFPYVSPVYVQLSLYLVVTVFLTIFS